MTGRARTTTFVTGAAGFVGTELVKVLSPRTTRLGPSAWGRCLTPALDRLDGCIVAGLPIVSAFPGLVARSVAPASSSSAR